MLSCFFAYYALRLIYIDLTISNLRRQPGMYVGSWCHPASPDSVEELRQLRARAAQRGDDCLATLLAGVDLFVALGRELEILELMRQPAHDLRDAVENTPAAQDLKRLYDMDDPGG